MRSKSAATLDRTGSIFILATVIVFIVIGAAGAFLFPALLRHRSTEQNIEAQRSFFLAEAGLSAAMDDLNTGGTGDLGSSANPVSYSSGTYYTDATLNGDGTYTIVTVASFNNRNQTITGVVEPGVYYPFGFALFGDEYVILDSNADSDSFDSRVGTYASHPKTKYQGQDHANTEGDTGSNGPITLYSNAKIWGDATPGPTSTVTLTNASTNLVSGSTAPAPAPRNIPPVTLPADYTTWGSGPYSTNLSIAGNDSYTLGSGSYYFQSFQLDSNTEFTVQGPTTIVVDSFELNSNVVFNIDATNGPVSIYGTGQFIINSNVQVNTNTQKAQDLAVYLTTDNISDPSIQVEFDSNTQSYFTLYAPNASIVYSSNADLYGSFVARRITLNSNMFFHYDEALGEITMGATGDVELISWRRGQ